MTRELQILIAMFVTDFNVWKRIDRSIAVSPDPASEFFFSVYAKNQLHQSLGRQIRRQSPFNTRSPFCGLTQDWKSELPSISAKKFRMTSCGTV